MEILTLPRFYQRGRDAAKGGDQPAWHRFSEKQADLWVRVGAVAIDGLVAVEGHVVLADSEMLWRTLFTVAVMVAAFRWTEV